MLPAALTAVHITLPLCSARVLSKYSKLVLLFVHSGKSNESCIPSKIQNAVGVGSPLASHGIDKTSPSDTVRLDGICVKCGKAKTYGYVKIERTVVRIIGAIKSVPNRAYSKR